MDERKVEIKVNESELILIIASMNIYNPGLVKRLELKEKLQELRRYNYPDRKSDEKEENEDCENCYAQNCTLREEKSE